MKRVSNSRNIGDIEFVIETLSVGDGKRSWTAHGVECTRDRHRFSGQAYDFTIEALELRMVRSGRISWRVLIVTEWWRSVDTDVEIRRTKDSPRLPAEASTPAAEVTRKSSIGATSCACR
jgi:hypothetical protein